MKRGKINSILCLLAAVAIIAPSYLSLENTTEQITIGPKDTSLNGPILAYSPTSHNFGNVQECQNYFTTFHIWNSGNGTLFWNLTTSQPWITVYPISGSSKGDKTGVIVQIVTTGLSQGWYKEFITINSNDPSSINTFTITFTISMVNQPPNTPSKPQGPSSGVVGTWYSYSTSTTDPDGDHVQYGLDWTGDGIVNRWSSFYPSGATYTIQIMFLGAGTYYLRFKARDVYGAESDFSPVKIVVISGQNRPPAIPETPIGPSTGMVGTSYSFFTSTTDPDNDKVRYGWDWTGDGVVDEWTGFFESGELVTLSHMYPTAGTYYIKVMAEDEHGAQSAFSESKKIEIFGGNPPNKPATPIGPRWGRIGVTYSYISWAIHPDGNDVEYLFDWGDGTNSGWIGPYHSGDAVTVSHTWSHRGSFPIKVQARDAISGEVSVWSESLPVGMPKGIGLVTGNHRFLEIYQTIFDFIQSFSKR